MQRWSFIAYLVRVKNTYALRLALNSDVRHYACSGVSQRSIANITENNVAHWRILVRRNYAIHVPFAINGIDCGLSQFIQILEL